MSQENQEKSIVRQLAENKLKKKAKSVAKKAARKAAAKVAQFARILISLLIKMVVALIGAIGIPTAGIVAIIIIVVILSSMVFSFLFGFGGGDDYKLEDDEQAIHEYIVEKANSTVNMNSDWERPYRVPEALISSVIQLDYLQSQEKSDIYDVIDKMTEGLKPVFDYGEYNEWKEVHVLIYEDGELVEDKGIERYDNWIDKLDHVDYWNGWRSFTYKPYTTDWYIDEEITYREETYTVKEIQPVVKTETITYYVWEEVPYEVEKVVPVYKTKIIIDPNGEPILQKVLVGYETIIVIEYRKEKVEKTEIIQYVVNEEVEVEKTRTIEVKTVTKTRYQRFTQSVESATDFTKLDNVLTSWGLGLEDKKLVEANYNFSTQMEMGYLNWLKSHSLISGGGIIGWDGNIIPGSGVPPQYMPYYRAAEEKYGVHWYVLAAIHFVETSFSQHKTMISPAGAIGHFQFLPATWAGWTYDIGGGIVSPDIDITDPAIIEAGGGYGVDANGDGKADPWDLEDAVHSAANYLAANGYSEDPRGAIWHYNHADWYVEKVLANAETYRTTAVYVPKEGDMPTVTDGSFMRPATGQITSYFGYRTLNGTTRLHAGVDIGQGNRTNVPIVSVANGTVSKVNTGCDPWNGYLGNSCGGQWGNYIMIKHNVNGTEYETVYAHLSAVLVAEGQEVAKGQMIGIMGNSGSSTGAHLHFEIHSPNRVQGNANVINPITIVPF